MPPLFLVALLASVFTFVTMYIDGRLFDVKRSKATYMKNMALVALVSCAAVYFFSQVPSLAPGGSTVSNLGAVRFVDGEQILTGLPNF